MNANAKKWVDRLRSGKDQQGYDALRNGEGRCCLGVACDAFHEETGQGEWVQTDLGSFRFVVGAESQSSLVPKSVKDWLGLTSKDGTYGVDGTRSLASDNDSRQYDFCDIADIVEANEGYLFDASSA